MPSKLTRQRILLEFVIVVALVAGSALLYSAMKRERALTHAAMHAPDALQALDGNGNPDKGW
jgi:hypothetical protein